MLTFLQRRRRGCCPPMSSLSVVCIQHSTNITWDSVKSSAKTRTSLQHAGHDAREWEGTKENLKSEFDLEKSTNQTIKRTIDDHDDGIAMLKERRRRREEPRWHLFAVWFVNKNKIQFFRSDMRLNVVWLFGDSQVLFYDEPLHFSSWWHRIWINLNTD